MIYTGRALRYQTLMRYAVHARDLSVCLLTLLAWAVCVLLLVEP